MFLQRIPRGGLFGSIMLYFGIKKFVRADFMAWIVGLGPLGTFYEITMNEFYQAILAWSGDGPFRNI